MSEAYKSADADPAARSLRAQGRRTRAKLLNAAMEVFAERGYHAARVDDIVRAASTSHGTFYLYFANKEELLHALAVECAEEIRSLAGQLVAIAENGAGQHDVSRWLATFVQVYGEYGPVIRAWMENQVADRAVNALGVQAFTSIATGLARCIRVAGGEASPATIGALMAMLERYSYFVVSGRTAPASVETITTFTRVAYHGFFTPVD